MSEREIMRLWSQLTAERIELKDMKTELARREREFLRKAAALQFACAQKPRQALQ